MDTPSASSLVYPGFQALQANIDMVFNQTLGNHKLLIVPAVTDKKFIMTALTVNGTTFGTAMVIQTGTMNFGFTNSLETDMFAATNNFSSSGFGFRFDTTSSVALNLGIADIYLVAEVAGTPAPTAKTYSRAQINGFYVHASVDANNQRFAAAPRRAFGFTYPPNINA